MYKPIELYPVFIEGSVNLRMYMSQENTPAAKTEGKVVTLPLSKIKPYWRNPRDNEAGVPGVMQSITDYGYNQFIVVDTKNVIIVGHTRFKALTRLGWKKAKVIVADLPDEKAKQYRIVDNKSGEKSSWNDEFLIQELRETDLDVMQQFFEENLEDLIKVSTGATGWQEVTETSIETALLEEETAVAVLTGQRLAAARDVMCPKCGEEFSVL